MPDTNTEARRRDPHTPLPKVLTVAEFHQRFGTEEACAAPSVADKPLNEGADCRGTNFILSGPRIAQSTALRSSYNSLFSQVRSSRRFTTPLTSGPSRTQPVVQQPSPVLYSGALARGTQSSPHDVPKRSSQPASLAYHEASPSAARAC